MDIYNINSIHINGKQITHIDTDEFSVSNTHIPSSSLIKKSITTKNYISDYQYSWDISNYMINSSIPNNVYIPELYCTITFNDSIEYNDLIINSYTTENYKNTELISSNLEDYTNIKSSELKNVCSIYIHDNYPYDTIYIPSDIKFNLNSSSSSSTEYHYIPQILKFDYFYKIKYIKAPTIKIFTNTQIGHQVVKDNLILDNAAVVKCFDETTIYENTPINLLKTLKIIPNTQYIPSSNHDLIPTPNSEYLDITNSTTYQNPIIIRTHSSPANLLVFVKSGSILTDKLNNISTEYQIDSLYHNKIPASVSDSDYNISIFHNYLTLLPNHELKLAYGSIIYPYSEFNDEFEVLYNNQQFSLKNIELHGIARNPTSPEDKLLDGIYSIGGLISYNRSNQENQIFLPKGTILTPGSLITLSSTYLTNRNLYMASILGVGNYTTIIFNYYNTQNLNTYIILNTTTLSEDLYLPCINTDNIWKGHYAYPVLVANVGSKLIEGSEFYDISTYYNLNNATRPILSSSYRISMSKQSLTNSNEINYKDYSFIIRDSEFETINSNVYGYTHHISISGGITESGNYILSTSFGKMEIQKYKNINSSNLVIIIQSNLQIKPPILKNFTIIIHCDKDTVATIVDSETKQLNSILDESNQYIITYIPDTTIYDSIYNFCSITLSNGKIYFIELVPTVLNISGEYYDNEEYIKLTKNVDLSTSYELDSIVNTVYTKYNTLLKSGTKIAKNSIINNKIYSEDYIIPKANTPILIPSKPSTGSLLAKNSLLSAGSVLNGNTITTDIILPVDTITSEATQFLNIGSELAPGSNFEINSLLNGQLIARKIDIDGFLVIESDSTLNVGSIISAGSFITFENNIQYINRKDLIINNSENGNENENGNTGNSTSENNTNSGNGNIGNGNNNNNSSNSSNLNSNIKYLYNNSVIDKGSKITISSFINNSQIKYIIDENKNINSESSISAGSEIKSTSVLNIGSVLNGNYIRGNNTTLGANNRILSFTRILPNSTLLSGTQIKAGSILNGEKTYGNYTETTLTDNYICNGNETFVTIDNSHQTIIKANSKLTLNSSYILNDNNEIIITSGDLKTVQNDELILLRTINYLINPSTLIKSGSKIKIGSKINNELVDNTNTEYLQDDLIISDAGLNILDGSILKSGSEIIIGSIINGYEYTNIDKTAIPINENIIITTDNINKYSILNAGDTIIAGSKIYSGSIINDTEYPFFNPELNHNYGNNSADSNDYIMTKILKGSVISNGNIINGTVENGNIIDISGSDRHENTTVSYYIGNGKIPKYSRIIGGSTINDVEYSKGYDLIEFDEDEFIIDDDNNSEYIDRVIAVNSYAMKGSIISGHEIEINTYSNIDCLNVQTTFNNLTGFRNKFTNVSHVVYYNYGNKRVLLMKQFKFTNTISNINNQPVFYGNGSYYYGYNGWTTGSETIWQSNIQSGTIMMPGSTFDYAVYELAKNSIQLTSNYGEYVELDELELKYEFDNDIQITNGFNINLPLYALAGSNINGTIIRNDELYMNNQWLNSGSIIIKGSYTYCGSNILSNSSSSENTNTLIMPYDTFTTYKWDGFRISTLKLKKGSKIRLLKEYVLDNDIEIENNKTTEIALFSNLTRILNDDVSINSNYETRFINNTNNSLNNSSSNVICSGYKIINNNINISENKHTELSLGSELGINSIIKEYSTYHLLNNDIEISNSTILKAKTKIKSGSTIITSSSISPYIILDEDKYITGETIILEGSILNIGSNYYENYKTLDEDLNNIVSITCRNGSDIYTGSNIIKITNPVKTYDYDIQITNDTILESGSMIPYGSIIVSGSQINNKLIYGERTILDKDTKLINGDYLIKSGSTIIKGSIIKGVIYDEDVEINEDIYNEDYLKNGNGNNTNGNNSNISTGNTNGNNTNISIGNTNTNLNGNQNIYLKTGCNIIQGSYLGDTTFATTRQIEYNYSNGTLLNENSILAKDSIIFKGSIINGEEINYVDITDDIYINNSSSVEIGSILLNGSIIKKGSVINNKLYTTDERLLSNLTVLNSDSDLKQGTNIVSGSSIAPGSFINNIKYDNIVVLNDDLQVKNYAELLDGSILIVGSKIINEDGSKIIVGNLQDDGHFEENHGGNECKMKIREYGYIQQMGPPSDFIRLLISEDMENKYTYLTIDDLVVADACCIYSENNINNTNSRNNKFSEYIIVKQDAPIYNILKVQPNEVAILNQGSIIVNGNYEQFSTNINVIKVFNNEEEEPYGDNISTITIESEYFYSLCFNLKNPKSVGATSARNSENSLGIVNDVKSERTLSHVIFKNQKIIDPSNIIVNYGSNISFDTFNLKQIYIIPSEFTHIDLAKNNNWYRNCITKCLEYNNTLIYGIDNEKISKLGNRSKSSMSSLKTEEYVFNLFNIDSTVYITPESEFTQNLIKLCLKNRKLIGNIISKVNNQHLNLYVQSERYKKVIDEIEKYSYINLISEGYHNVLSEYELIKNTNILYINKNCYYDSTFGLEIIKSKNSETYYYSKNCLSNVKNNKNNKIIFTSNVTDSTGNGNYYMINFEDNILTINEDDIPNEIIIMPGTNLKAIYINKNNITLHLKDYIKILVVSDNPLDNNAMTIHLNENCQLDSIIIDEPTQLKRSNTTAMYINAKNFVFESTFNLGSMENYAVSNRNIYVNYKLLDLTYELDNDIKSGYLTVVESSDYGISGVSHVLKYQNPDDDISKYQGSVRNDGIIVDIDKFEELRGYKNKMIFSGLINMKQYFNNQNLVLLILVRETLKVPGIAIVNEYCNIYVYYDLNTWRTANFKAHSYTKVAE